jgi:AcrR family transcriptional regulator
MLLYFFGTKEQLISEALAYIRTREQLDFQHAISKSKPEDIVQSLLRNWRLSASPSRARYSRLFFEIYGLALQDRKRFPHFLEHAVGDWLPLFERALAEFGLPPASARTLATLALGAIRGLHLDLLATGERRRTEAAFREMLNLLSLAVQSRTNQNRPKRPKSHRRNEPSIVFDRAAAVT